MKKLRLLLALIAASIGSVQGAWAERVAPTMPTTAAPQTEQQYYLYNLDAGLFFGFEYVNGYGNKMGIFEQPTAITLEAVSDLYQFCFMEGNSKYLFYASSNGNCIYTSAPYSDSSSKWEIISANGSYRIRWNSELTYYDENLYLGKKADSENLRCDCSESENIRWAFIPVNDAADRFVAEMKLYNALCAMDAYSNKGYYTDEFESTYTNRSATSVDDLTTTARTLRNAIGLSNDYKYLWWNEKPILFYTDEGTYGKDNSNYENWRVSDNSIFCTRYYDKSDHAILYATVNLDGPSVLVYTPTVGHDKCSLDVYIDNVKVRHFEYGQYHKRFFEELTIGVHTIKWDYSLDSNDHYDYSQSIKDVGIIASPLITVNLLEPGSMGTEVLYNVNNLKDVRRLKVKGTMNDEDWAKIKMMTGLQTLDLSEAITTEIPERQFYLAGSADSAMQFLHAVILPEGLKRINEYAFNNSFIDEVNFPTTVEYIGSYAFAGTHLKTIALPDNLTIIENGTFEYMYWLENMTLPQNLKEIRSIAFYLSNKMRTTLPQGLTSIGSYAFYGCASLTESLVIPKSVTNIGDYAFIGCTSLKYLELNENLFALNEQVFLNCPNLETLKLYSPTVVTYKNNYRPLSDISSLAHLQVPHYLVNLYKQDEYWYNAQSVEGFDYSSMEYIPMHGNITLTHERFGGTPSVMIDRPYYLKVLGDDAQQFNNLTIYRDYDDYNGYGQIYSDCPNLSITGDLCVNYRTKQGKWNFICLPFDLDISRITHDQEGVQFAIRYYDGANRAQNGKSGSWKDCDRTTTIPAGTGFILQTNKDCWTSLFAANTAAKQNIVVNPNEGGNGFSKSLALNSSEDASNRGWNLVGNPYQCHYNNHTINYTAPITVWDPSSSTYTAYSLTDDDYALRPNEAFFVQCPGSEAQTISFPLQGRQLDNVIESQNAVKAMNAAGQTRFLIDLGLSFGESTDKTRVVFNEEAEMGYEISRDASKFMSMDKNMAQLYTLDAEGLHYAINERPSDNGKVQLGFYTARNGAYTLSALRNMVGDIYLTDLQEGICVNLANEGYTFNATAGTDETRFVLSLKGNVTGIESIENGQLTIDNDVIYDLSGRRVENAQKGVFIQNNKKVVVK